MKGKKDKLAQWLHFSGLIRLLNFGRDRQCFVLNYHRIRGQGDPQTLFNDEVYGPDQQEFEQQVRWLTSNSDILSEEDMINVVQGKYKPPGRSVLITFDDGYIDNFTLAYPVLRKYHAPAIFFVPTQSIEKRRLGWWDHFAYLLKTTSKREVIFEGKVLYPKENMKEAIQFVLHLIDNNKQEVSVVLERLMAACEVDLPGMGVQDSELMSWKQLQEVSDNGITIGAHSHTHTVLSSLGFEQQKDEMENSKAIIEKRLGRHVRTMSYPVGNYRHFTEKTKEIARDAGYELAFSFLTGINTYGTIDPMNVKRISVSSYLPRFACTLQFPGLFCDCV